MYQLFFFSLFSFVHFFLFFIFSTFSSHASNAQMYLIKINDYVLRNTNDCISCMKHENVKLSLSKNLHHVIVSRQRLRYTGRYRQLDISFLFFSTKVSLAIYHFVLDHIRVDNQWNKTKLNLQRTIYPRH